MLLDELFRQRATVFDERVTQVITFGAGHIALFDHSDASSQCGTARLDDELAVLFEKRIEHFGRRLFDLEILASRKALYPFQ